MGYKNFLSDTKAALETRLDHVVPKHDALIERRAKLNKILKAGLAEAYQDHYKHNYPRYPNDEPIGHP